MQNQKDPLNKRRSEYPLTETGKDQAARLELYNIEAADVFKVLDSDLVQGFGTNIGAGRDKLLQKSMANRFAELFDSGEKS